MATPLKVSREIGVTPPEKCPSCGRAFPPDKPVCGQCGFDRRLGRRPIVSEPPRGRRSLRLLALAAVTAAVAAVALSRLGSRARGGPDSAPTATDHAPSQAAARRPEPEPAPPPTALDLQRAAVREKLDRNQPLYREGDEVAVRTRIGQIKRGRLIERAGKSIALEDRPGETDTVLYSDLDQASRIRCDPEFRENYVRYRAEQLTRRGDRR